VKNVWVLSVKTSLPEVCKDVKDFKSTTLAFENFEKGKEAFRKLIKDFAFSKNAMFDGDGSIIYLKKYINDLPDEEIIDDYESLDKYRLGNLADALRDAFSGKDFDFEMESEYTTDYFIAVESTKGNILIRGEDDGPCNGYDPLIKTNIFSMKEEKNYYLYIDDLLGQDYSAELYIDLTKAELQ